MSVVVGSRYFGLGSRHDFAHYFSGTSAVSVSGVEEVIDWLLTAEYQSDLHLFREPDYWQHPLTFEQLRRGDCEDFALWAWRKLTELGIQAEFFVGRTVHDRAGAPPALHAWVVFQIDGADYLLETVARERTAMLSTLDEARSQYVPYYAVDRTFRTSAFGGYLLDWNTLPVLPDVRSRAA
jgi:hypothetical protein